jgi:hypothetical protein
MLRNSFGFHLVIILALNLGLKKLNLNLDIIEFLFLDHFDPFLLAAMVPIKSYSNAEADKAKILKENTNKSGIYMWKNSINGKRYIGSSENCKKKIY